MVELRMHQCPGCWGCALQPADRPVECLECGEKMTVIDLRASNLYSLEEYARFIATLDDSRALELRRSITLTEIIKRAKEALGREYDAFHTRREGERIASTSGESSIGAD